MWGENHIIKEYGDKFAVLEDNILNSLPTEMDNSSKEKETNRGREGDEPIGEALKDHSATMKGYDGVIGMQTLVRSCE